ncbi:MAG: hypothetical protein ACJ76I_12050 [Gaiellaceae bacterium]
MNARERQKLYAESVGADALARQLRAAAPKCKSCLRPMLWVTTNRGRHMPVDFDPHEAGNVVVFADGRADIYREAPSVVPNGATLHFSHLATCPNADEYRRSA